MKHYLPLYVLLLICSTGIYSKILAHSSSEWILLEDESKKDALYKQVPTKGSYIILKVVGKTNCDMEFELYQFLNFKNYLGQIFNKTQGLKLFFNGEKKGGGDSKPKTDYDNQLVIDISAVKNAPMVKFYEV